MRPSKCRTGVRRSQGTSGNDVWITISETIEYGTMADFVLIEGDKANFLPNFGPAVVVVNPAICKAADRPL